MTAVAAVLAALAVLLLPGRRAGSRAPAPAPRRPPGSSTVLDAADALDLCALAVRSGLAPLEALDAVADRAPEGVAADLRVVAAALRWGRSPTQAWQLVSPVWRPAALAWRAAEEAGAAPAALITQAARRMRVTEQARIERAVQRSGVLLVLPLGLCFLPGFVCTTIVPVVLLLAQGLTR